MQAILFDESVAKIMQREKKYHPQAYFFLKDALDFTLKQIASEDGGGSRNVSGKELLEGFRDFALEQFGPMAVTLMQEWGIRDGGDVGEMVFLLIEEQIFGRQDSDTKEDFVGHFPFLDSLRKPFLPKAQLLAVSGRA